MQFYRYMKDLVKIKIYLIGKRNRKSIGMISINIMLYLRTE